MSLRLNQTTYFFLLLFLCGTAPARQEPQICGSHPMRGKQEIALHRHSMRRLAARGRAAAAQAQPAASRDAGDIAIIEDDGGIISRRNEFDLDRKQIKFTPSNAAASRYRFAATDGGWDAEAAANGLAQVLDDDDAREIAFPFPFPFFGKSYTKAFLNSDGNLTFDQQDTSIADRNLGRLTAGPPRIAAHFRDLDPSQTPNGVKFLSQPNRVVISFLNVPDYVPFGFGPPNTFQIRLYPDGVIEIAYQGITSRTGVTGIAPGGLAPGTALVDFSTPSTQDYAGAIAEAFSNLEEIDIVFAAQRFYETHEDAYDYLAIYNAAGIAAGSGAVAYEVTVRNDRLGIGDVPVDDGLLYGSPTRLQAVLNLGPLSQYPRDPNAVVPARSTSKDTPLTILGHEAGHLFLAFVSVREEGNPSLLPMLGRQSAHWSFLFNSDASLLEGNRIQDGGPGATPRFMTTATVEGYSALDQYLMGLRPPEEVPPTFVVTNATTGPTNRQPQAGVSFDGFRRDITIQELVLAEGRRVPDHTVAQRRFRIGFILVTPKGATPSAEDLSQIEAYRHQFEPFYAKVTGDRATAQTSLKRSLTFSAAPAAGVVAGASARFLIATGRAVETPLTVLLRPRSGLVAIPASVQIPAGQRQASFTITGLQPGVEEVTAEPSDTNFETAVAKLQVLGGQDRLRLVAVSGDKQKVSSGMPLPRPVVVRATDSNNLPYPGITISAAVTQGGSVTPASAVSDEKGEVRFQWTPGPGQNHELRASVGGLGVNSLMVTALGQPEVSTGGVVNSASFQPGLAQGSLATIFGVNLASGATGIAAPPWRVELGRVQVRINRILASLLYVSDRQINLMVPASVPLGEVDIEIESGIGQSPQRLTSRASVVAFQPGVFLADPATGLGAILTAGTGQLTSARPPQAGDIVEIYGTGLGLVQISQRFPGLLETATIPAVSIGGAAAEVLFSGQAPGIPGLYQVNARVPDGLAPGRHPVVVEAGGVASRPVSMQTR